jgi:Nucleotide modification associated domain 3
MSRIVARHLINRVTRQSRAFDKIQFGEGSVKIIFSRKGFDSTSGRAPSPIIDGALYGLPIPTGKYPSRSTYGALDLGDALSKVQSKYTARCFCHEDPMFWNDRCAFGQIAAAQTHLKKNCVGEGDVFLFFGLFAQLGSNDRHHRIFGYLKVESVLKIGCHPSGHEVRGMPRQHPHTIEKWDTDEGWPCNNTIYVGRGGKAKNAHKALRLTKEGGRTSHWVVPPWLSETKKLSYHKASWRWREYGTLHSASPGQEFVTDIGDRREPKKWLNDVIALIEADK